MIDKLKRLMVYGLHSKYISENIRYCMHDFVSYYCYRMYHFRKEWDILLEEESCQYRQKYTKLSLDLLDMYWEFVGHVL